MSSALRTRCVWPKRPGLLRLRRTLSRLVVKLMDYGRGTSTEAAQKARDARRNQANTQLKEIRFRTQDRRPLASRRATWSASRPPATRSRS